MRRIRLASRPMKSVRKPVGRMRSGPVLDAVQQSGGRSASQRDHALFNRNCVRVDLRGKIGRATAAVLLARASGAKLESLIGL